VPTNVANLTGNAVRKTPDDWNRGDNAKLTKAGFVGFGIACGPTIAGRCLQTEKQKAAPRANSIIAKARCRGHRFERTQNTVLRPNVAERIQKLQRKTFTARKYIAVCLLAPKSKPDTFSWRSASVGSAQKSRGRVGQSKQLFSPRLAWDSGAEVWRQIRNPHTASSKVRRRFVLISGKSQSHRRRFLGLEMPFGYVWARESAKVKEDAFESRRDYCEERSR
jgi:hypothetical protein